MLVGLCGYGGVGKDAVGACMVGYKRAAFADAIKADLKPLLVAWGKVCREVDPLYWIKNIAIPWGNVVITDLRYINEAVFVWKLGGWVIHLSRPGIGPANDEERRSIDELIGKYDIPTIENDRTPEECAATIGAYLSSPLRLSL